MTSEQYKQTPRSHGLIAITESKKKRYHRALTARSREAMSFGTHIKQNICLTTLEGRPCHV